MLDNFPYPEKRIVLLKLARQRQADRMDGYACIGDFHGGLYECDHVSPYTKSGCNVDARIMIVGQDWSSADRLGSEPPDLEAARLGYTPTLPTNKNLDALLLRHFRVTRTECYLTNLFPFIKYGNLSANIPMTDLVSCAGTYTLKEIAVVSPRIVICLGLRTFEALRRAVGQRGALRLVQAVHSPLRVENAMVHCVAHTGQLGMNNRGRAQVDADWQRIVGSLTEPFVGRQLELFHAR